DFLEVEDDVGHVLDDVGNRGELVHHAFDPDCRDRHTLKGRQKDAPEAVSDRRPESTLQRLGRESPVRVRQGVPVDLQALRFNQTSPVSLCDCQFHSWTTPYFEYSSTTKFS